MSERGAFADNPPIEQQVAVLFERIGTFIQATNDKLGRMETMLETALHLRSDVDRQGEWQAKHDIHHGDDDVAVARRLAHDDSPVGARIKENEGNIATLMREVFDAHGHSRIKPLEQAHHDALTTRGVYLTQARALVAFTGIAGTFAAIGVAIGLWA